MKPVCMISKSHGYILTFCKYFLFITISLCLLHNNALAEGEIRAKSLFKIKSTSEQKFSQPSNFAVDTKDNVYILEDLNEKVLVYNKNGKFISSFTSEIDEKVNLYKAYSIASDDFNFLHIFDPYENNIMVFSGSGELKKTIHFDFDDKKTHKITELVFAYNNYYLIDNELDYFYIFNTSGRITRRLGKKGEVQGEFRNPFSMTLDQEGRIYITDVLNSRVQVYTSTGTYLSQISDFGFTNGGVFRPNGIAADVNNNIYISDVFLGVIYVFKPDGTYISPVMNKGKAIKFKTPSRIRINNKRLYVLETLNNTISVYQLL